ncbi:hypothetical protein D3C85_1745750 [compost metagenome]
MRSGEDNGSWIAEDLGYGQPGLSEGGVTLRHVIVGADRGNMAMRGIYTGNT